MSLRLLLVILGVIIIAGVYFFTAVKKRRESQASFERGFSRLDVPDVILQHDEDEPAVPEIPAEPPRFADGVVLPPEEEALGDLPRVVNELAGEREDDGTNARIETDQMDLFGAAPPVAPSAAAPTPAPDPAPALAPQPAPASAARGESKEPEQSGLINLFIRARDQQSFAGPELVRAFNAVGMTHGDMDIFHHHGVGELACEQAVFSAANMFEPGTFDLNRIEAFRTAGVVLFMELPTALDGAVAFELLLNSAQRLAELTGGELYATPREPLTAREIAALRDRASRFAHARG